MNPELAKAIAALRRQQDQIEDHETFLRQATGGKFGVDDAQKYLDGMKEQDLDAPGRRNTGRRAMGIGREVLSGLTRQWFDEGLNKLKPGLGDDFNLRSGAYRKEHPIEAVAGNVAGAALPALIPGVGSRIAATTVPRAMAMGAAIGGGEGFLSAMGDGEGGFKERAAGAVVPGVMGAAAGAAIPGAAGTYRYLTRPDMVARRTLRGIVKQNGGTQALRDRFDQFENAGLGDETVAADLMDPLRDAAEESAQRSPFSRNMIEKSSEARLRGNIQRTTDRIRKDTKLANSNTGDINADQALETLQNSRRSWASQAYAKLDGRMANTEFATKTQRAIPEAFNQPKVRDAVKAAQEAELIGKFPVPSEIATFAKFQEVKSRMEGMISKAFKEGNGGLGRRLKEALASIDQHVEDNVMDYRIVSNEYKRRMKLERAIEKGVDGWLDADSRMLKDMVAKMSPQEQFRFRQGMASTLIKDLRTPGKARAVANKLHAIDAEGAAESALQDKLEIIFGDKKTFEAFGRYGELERELTRLRGSYDNSKTARRVSAMAREPGDVALQGLTTSMGTTGANMVKAQLARFGARSIRENMASGRAAEMAPLLMQKGRLGIDDLIAMLETPEGIAGRGAQLFAPIMAGSAANGLLGPRR